MALRRSARCSRRNFFDGTAEYEEQSGISLDARRMNYGTGARSDFTARQARSPRQNLSRNALAAPAVAGIILAWTLHATVFVGDIAPAMVSANFQPAQASSSSEAMTFTARFAALGFGPEGISVVRKSAPAPRAVPDAIRKNYMAL